MIFEAKKDFFKQNAKTAIDMEKTSTDVITSKLYREDEMASGRVGGDTQETRV